MMTLSRYNSVGRVLVATLLFSGMSLALNPQVRAQEPASVSKEPAPLKRQSPSTDAPNSHSRALTATATSMGTAGGVVGGYIGGVIVCDASGFGGGVWGMDCLFNPVVFGGTVLTGIAGGYLGYKNNRPIVTLGGALTGTGVGMILWLPSNTDELLLPVVLLSAGAGGYLGHRLWKVREASGSRYSLTPYWDQENSGVMVFGEF